MRSEAATKHTRCSSIDQQSAGGPSRTPLPVLYCSAAVVGYAVRLFVKL
jgi:hypothetical protein